MKHANANSRIVPSLLALLCALLVANLTTTIMVRRTPTTPSVPEPITQSQPPHQLTNMKQSPEDSSMKTGLFRENNTSPPKETQVLPLFSLKGKTAIVSGSGAGIGLAVVQAFAEAGANVAIWYHSNKSALERAREVEERWGVKCKLVQCYECSASSD